MRYIKYGLWVLSAWFLVQSATFVVTAIETVKALH